MDTSSDDDCWLDEECDTTCASSKISQSNAISSSLKHDDFFNNSHGEFGILADKLLNRTNSMSFQDKYAPVNEFPESLLPLLKMKPGQKYVVSGVTGSGKTTFATLAMLHAKQNAFAMSAHNFDAQILQDLTASSTRPNWTSIIDDLDDVPMSTVKQLSKSLKEAKGSIIFLCHTLTKSSPKLRSLLKDCVHLKLKRTTEELRYVLRNCGCTDRQLIDKIVMDSGEDFRAALISVEANMCLQTAKRQTVQAQLSEWMSMSNNKRIHCAQDYKHLWLDATVCKTNANLLISAESASDYDFMPCNMLLETYLCSVCKRRC